MRIPSVAPCKRSAEVFAGYIAPLYFRDEDIFLDPCFGKGNFWSIYKPKRLIKHDLFLLDEVDARNLPEEDNSVDIVVLDLPLVSKGGRNTSGMKEFDAAYGLKRAPKSPEALHLVIAVAMVEAYRVLKRGGLLINKSCDYISSGKYIPGHFWVVRDALKTGFFQVDEIIHYRGSLGPQPPNRGQKHSHRSHSFYSIFIKP